MRFLLCGTGSMLREFRSCLLNTSCGPSCCFHSASWCLSRDAKSLMGFLMMSCSRKKSKGLILANSLAIEGLHAGYGEVRVLSGISINVRGGETVVPLGTNGNGKSTLIKCIMGQVRPTAGRIVATIDGTSYDLIGRSTEDIVGIGISLVPEGRRLFPKLTVEENLLLGAFREFARARISDSLAFCFDAFPRLKERRRQLAGS